MHIVIVCDYAYPFGGAEKVAIDSAMALARAGVSVHFIAGVGPVDEALAQSPVEVHLADVPELSKKGTAELLVTGLWSPRCAALTKQVLTALPRGQTLVHVHCWQRALTTSTLRACRESGHPLLFTLHDYGVACPNQGFFDYQRNEICTRKALGPSCLATHCDSRTYVHKLWRASRTGLQHALAAVPEELTDVIYISALSREVLAPYFSARTRWHALRNPIDAVPGPRVRAEQNRGFLFVGAVARYKGVLLFGEATARAGVPGVVVGDGPELDEMKRAYPHLTYLGRLKPHDVRGALAQARALVFPSLWYEGQPMVVQEALASGVPLLIADRTAAREAVDDGKKGLLFEHMNVAHLATQLRRLVDDDVAVQAMSEHAHTDFWADPPTLAAHVAGLRTLYADCLRRSA
jgi:glycosyltransferase involved in cell wall biosynthesis